MMDEDTKQKIVEWIFNNQKYHGYTIIYDDEDTICTDGDVPYINSLELENFIKGL